MPVCGQTAKSGLIAPRICQPPAFVDTRSGIWHMLKTKPRRAKAPARAGEANS